MIKNHTTTKQRPKDDVRLDNFSDVFSLYTIEDDVSLPTSIEDAERHRSMRNISTPALLRGRRDSVENHTQEQPHNCNDDCHDDSDDYTHNSSPLYSSPPMQQDTPLESPVRLKINGENNGNNNNQVVPPAKTRYQSDGGMPDVPLEPPVLPKRLKMYRYTSDDTQTALPAKTTRTTPSPYAKNRRTITCTLVVILGMIITVCLVPLLLPVHRGKDSEDNDTFSDHSSNNWTFSLSPTGEQMDESPLPTHHQHQPPTPCSQVSADPGACRIQMQGKLGNNNNLDVVLQASPRSVLLPHSSRGSNEFTVTDNVLDDFNNNNNEEDVVVVELEVMKNGAIKMEAGGVVVVEPSDDITCEGLLFDDRYTMKNNAHLTFTVVPGFSCTAFGENIIYYLVMEWFYVA